MFVYLFVGLPSYWLSGVGSLWVNFKRARLVQTGFAIQGRLVAKKRILLLHEMIRPQAHRTFKITYEYQVEQKAYSQTLYLCLCAYEHLNEQEDLLITYMPTRPKKSLPLRVAVMVIPH